LGGVIYIVEKRITSTHEVEELDISVLRRTHLEMGLQRYINVKGSRLYMSWNKYLDIEN
jgi:hypothetical protein